MSVIHLVRHAQASWGADDYDALSDLGVAQGGWLGAAWEAGAWMPSHAIAGGMRRHAQTAIAALDAAGPSDGYEVDDGWNEFDHVAIAGGFPRPGSDAVSPPDPKAFQQVLNEGLVRWSAGEGEFEESYAAFVDRVMAAFDRTVSMLGKGDAGVVFTSGGPIAMVASQVLTGDDSIWRRLNNVIVNSSVTKIVVGASGTNLLSFNEHGHLPADAITYR